MAQRATAFLRNVLARVPAFGQDIAAVRTPTELIAEPVQEFIALTPPSAMSAEPDVSLAFTEEALGDPFPADSFQLLTVPREQGQAALIFAEQNGGIRSLTADAPDIALPPRNNGTQPA